ncbi:hypothetical protein [Alicyclobacillus sp. ALC3]|uniref:hypothetical protein n=1 Tax=Alicyclobacillus sp. ALC3 TaxID=2796143 RepID=UPI00237952E2|nr:hypothetical protein [Alicyclobacillus sp. ALC3]WDL96933.1 hypothetical protein JC200_22085 [Alicyclobacillus sp. ALC3]
MGHDSKAAAQQPMLRSVILRGDTVVSEEELPAYSTTTIIVKGGHVNFHNVTHEKRVE